MNQGIAARVRKFFATFGRQSSEQTETPSSLKDSGSQDSDTDDDIAKQVKQLLWDVCRLRPEKIRLSSRLEEDLGITGLDAVELLETFSQKFDVDLSGFEFYKHFGPEFLGPEFLFMPYSKSLELEFEMRDFGKYPVTVAHLINIAKSKRWSCPPAIT